MAKETPAKYSPAALAAILAAVEANGGVANAAVAETLVDNPETGVKGHPDVRVDADGNVRNKRHITAKMSLMARDGTFTYERKGPVTKSGEPVTKKVDLVARLATRAGIPASVLNGMEISPKGALDALVKALAA